MVYNALYKWWNAFLPQKPSYYCNKSPNQSYLCSSCVLHSNKIFPMAKKNDFTLIGAGIMSATLGVLIKKLMPDLK